MGRIGFFTASTAVIAYQMGMDITGNNLANVNTYGFKAARPSFADLIYDKRNNDIEEVQTGHGIKVDKTDYMFEQSSLRTTGRNFDFAALNEGFFAVETPSGNIAYSKDGAFYMTDINGDGTGWQLCDSKGSFVLDYEGNRIEIPFDENRQVDTNALRDSIGTYRFENPYGLDQFGDNYVIPTGSSGEAFADENVRKMQGYLEASGTSVANEMSKVIEYQRAFQLNINMVKLHDDLINVVNNLRN
ncbi:MAG: flagellar hook-basal body protein [Oscillospiraceae bacterium]|nr:flagellar hook-basal body protein [Oscillospiraceae bacterium]